MERKDNRMISGWTAPAMGHYHSILKPVASYLRPVATPKKMQLQSAIQITTSDANDHRLYAHSITFSIVRELKGYR